MSTEVTIPDIAPFTESLKNVRADGNPINWALAGHVGGDINILEYRNSGTGGLAELEGHLKDDEVMYVLVRLEEKFDLTKNVKFVYIHWIGSQVPFTKKGRYGIVHGAVADYFGQSHCSVETSGRDDLTEEAIMKLINETSGTKSKVMDKSEAATRKDRGFTSSSNIVRTGKQMAAVNTPAAVTVKIDDSVVIAIADVRKDETTTNWCVAEYEGNNPKNPIVLRGQGSNGIDEIKACLEEDKVAYALFRSTDVVDGISTVKFVFIQWVGVSVKPMAKGKISTHKSTIEKVFSPAHVFIYATSESEISLDVIMDKVASASGSKSHVRNTTTIR